MKRLDTYVNEYESNIYEGRRPKKIEGDAAELVGVPAKKNLKLEGYYFGLDEPTEDKLLNPIDLDDPENTESMQDLIAKFDAHEPFFIRGKAGWGKTSIIKKLAFQYGLHVITVYLDKAEATDLGGVPIPAKGRKAAAVQKIAMPAWAEAIDDNPDVQFLLFFDEMNQADYAVMNALMPIVKENEICGVKYKNFFVGAAGNFKSENAAVQELSEPLASRFAPLIEWEAGTDRAWKSACDHLRKKYAGIWPADFLDTVFKCCKNFKNPREIDEKTIGFLTTIKDNPAAVNRLSPEKLYRRLMNLASEDITPTGEKEMAKLADYMNDYLKTGKINGEKVEGDHSRRKKDREMVPEDLKDEIMKSIKKGYTRLTLDNGKEVKFGVSRENIFDIVDEDECNAEMLQRILRKLEAENVKFKYEKDADFAGRYENIKDYQD